MIPCRSKCNMNCSSFITLPLLFLFTLSPVHGGPARSREGTGDFRDSAVESLQPLSRSKRDSESGESSEENHHYGHTRRYDYYQEPQKNQFLLAFIRQLLTHSGGTRRPAPRAHPALGGTPPVNAPALSPDIPPAPDPGRGQDLGSLTDFLTSYMFDQPDDPQATFPEAPLVKVPPAPPSRPKKKRVRRP